MKRLKDFLSHVSDTPGHTRSGLTLELWNLKCSKASMWLFQHAASSSVTLCFSCWFDVQTQHCASLRPDQLCPAHSSFTWPSWLFVQVTQQLQTQSWTLHSSLVWDAL